MIEFEIPEFDPQEALKVFRNPEDCLYIKINHNEGGGRELMLEITIRDDSGRNIEFDFILKDSRVTLLLNSLKIILREALGSVFFADRSITTERYEQWLQNIANELHKHGRFGRRRSGESGDIVVTVA